GEVGEDAAALGDAAHAGAHERVRPGAVHVAAADVHAAGARRDVAGDDLERGRLAGAVGAEQCVDGAGRHGEVDAVQHLDPAVAGVQVDQLDRVCHGATTWPASGAADASA